jgi:ribosomal protein L13E
VRLLRWLLVASFRVFEFAARDAGVTAREASSWGIIVSFRVFFRQSIVRLLRWLLVASFRVFEFAARDAGVAAREASSWGIVVSFRVFARQSIVLSVQRSRSAVNRCLGCAVFP